MGRTRTPAVRSSRARCRRRGRGCRVSERFSKPYDGARRVTAGDGRHRARSDVFSPAGSFDRGLYRDARRGLTLARLAGAGGTNKRTLGAGRSRFIGRTGSSYVCMRVHGMLVYMFHFVRMSRDDERTDANSSSQI